jgi:hypothetical protein
MSECATDTRCIYCPRPAALQGEGDHVIPHELGEFREDQHFKRICVDCNSKIGKSESVLLRCGPERFFREIVMPSSCNSMVGAEGLPPPLTKVFTKDGPWKGHLGAGLTVEMKCDELVLEDKNGRETSIQLFPKMTVSGLKKCLDRQGIEIKSVISARHSWSDENASHYKDLLREVWGKGLGFAVTSTWEKGLNGRVRAVTECKVNTRYFQALAKIAFHYYLLKSDRVSGREDCFKPIRDFIMNGGDYEKFLNSPQKFHRSKNETLIGWRHRLAASEVNGVALGYVGLFQGLQAYNSDYEFVLGRISKLILPERVWVDGYFYDDPIPKGKKVGEVRPIGRPRVISNGE